MPVGCLRLFNSSKRSYVKPSWFVPVAHWKVLVQAPKNIPVVTMPHWIQLLHTMAASTDLSELKCAMAQCVLIRSSTFLLTDAKNVKIVILFILCVFQSGI